MDRSVKSSGYGKFTAIFAGVASLLGATGCDLKFPGPKFEFDLPDAAILQNFAGNGAFPGAAGNGAPLLAVTPPQSQPGQPASALDGGVVAVDASTPQSPCPSDQIAINGTCRPRAGVVPQCAPGASACSNGACCPGGSTCSPNGGCEHAGETPSGATAGTCSGGGQVVTRDGSNCPAHTAARCCPAGSVLYCTDTDNPDSALCAVQASVGACLAGFIESIDNMTQIHGCCPAVSGLTVMNAGYCFYAHPAEPTCDGAKNEVTGTCCAGQTTNAGGCCAAGHQACGNACCGAGESCDLASNRCVGTQPAAAASCPAELPRDCSSTGGHCCSADSQCKPDGSCGCPAAMPVDCGGFCAASAEQCHSCPSDHPDVCGAQCCLRGGCGASATPGACGCPSGSLACGSTCCPSGSQCSNGQCLSCPGNAPVLCGTSCCAAGQACVNNQCVGG